MYKIKFISKKKGVLGTEEFTSQDKCAFYLAESDWGTRYSDENYPPEEYGKIYMSVYHDEKRLGSDSMLLIIALVNIIIDYQNELIEKA